MANGVFKGAIGAAGLVGQPAMGSTGGLRMVPEAKGSLGAT